MGETDLSILTLNLLTILTAGFVAGAVSRWLNISMLIGYMVIGAIIGAGGLGLVVQPGHELEYLARFGALLLLFSVGIEFSLEELMRMGRFLSVGGSVQMLTVAAPLTVGCLAFGVGWQVAILIGAAVALSSTVLVFKALAELGQMSTPHGRRAVGILLFQDIALVPLMLLVPLLTGSDEGPSLSSVIQLGITSVIFVVAVLAMREIIRRWMVDQLSWFRSVELIVLFTVVILGGTCWASAALGLPPAIGALAAGLMMSGNRLSKQIDTVILPFRESFAAVFFVTLGTLLDVRIFLSEPGFLTAGLVGTIVLKGAAAALALRLTGLKWLPATGMGLGLAQMGEFSFLLIAEGLAEGVISAESYNRVLFIAMGTLIATPPLIKLGMRWCDVDHHEEAFPESVTAEPIKEATIMGAGPIGRQVASRLELMGVESHIIDLSPINLHALAQLGFHTVAGDARNDRILKMARVPECTLVVVAVPDDEIAKQVVHAVRQLNADAAILVRCRYQATVPALKKLGAEQVVSEEVEASDRLAELCRLLIESTGTAQ
ncbi:cation:proton antiporter [Calycomorphotria hydatis]|uniref:Inner membrane protein YbaL n=1 Tax=Calycomorphotria hydatis TaxID=2528027 RepID=A0A517T4R0_9PLAN|nr:cation:proton antiporter [Calycomorphotria hydatis]QDT63367.1 Inner membrane protein YbaL [Calycomorphotria hydatis]